MAPFNWFNRQFSDPSDAEAPSTEAQVTEAPSTEAQATEATDPLPAEQPPGAETEAQAQAQAQTGETPAVAQDQLNWAKLAYENIRKRQAQTTNASPVEQPTASENEVVLSPEAPEAPIASIAETIAETIPKAIPRAIDSSEATEPEMPIAATPAPVLESPEIAPEASPAPLPFWAQAEAERLERLERLKQEAIAAETLAAETLAAKTIASVALTEAAPTSDLAMDEGFLWSAEVLAAQGRRPEDVSIEEITWLKRLRQGLDKTRRSLMNQLRAIVGQGPLNQDAVMEIESLLLQADVGVEATDYIIESLQNKLRQETLPPSEAIAYLKTLLQEMLDKPLEQNYEPTLLPEKGRLNIWLVTGVNGAGKTTTIGKLTHIAQKSGYRCLIAAADTFRAAAVQQVQVWGDRSNVEVIANPGKNTDPAAVVFDAIAAAQARGTELLIVDTAGRLQNKKNLMDELSKIRRIIDKKAPDAKVESLLVLDSTLGQNGLRQAEVFSEAAKLSGVVLTKLDGTAKGGIALAVVQQLGLPIRFIGAGEGIEDLRPFSSYEFVEALLSG